MAAGWQEDGRQSLSAAIAAEAPIGGEIKGSIMDEIIVLGGINMDLVVKTQRMPQAGETVLGEHFEAIPGGKGANQAAAIARLGGSVSMIGSVGQDAFGSQLEKKLATIGVDTDQVSFSKRSPTGTATIIVDASGENQIIVVPGANGDVREEQVDQALARIKRSAYLVAQFEIPTPTVEYGLLKAKEWGVSTILNPAPAMEIDMGLLSLVDLLIVNEIEASHLSDINVYDLTSAREAANALHRLGSAAIAITLGEKGAIILKSSGTYHIPAPLVKAVDTTAAGDAFVGALATRLAQGANLRDASRFAVAAGSSTATKFGAQPSLPTLDDVMSMLDQMKE